MAKRGVAHRLAVVATGTVLALLAALIGTAPTTSASTASERVIVQGLSATAARLAVEAVGGHVRVDLPIVDGVAADVPTRSLPTLAATPGVRAVTPDVRMTVQGSVESPADGKRPKSVYPRVVKADRLAARGATGQGITVALLDTGISPTPDLDGRVLPIEYPGGTTQDCVNLTGEPTCADGYGHGTFLAGIIAGDGTASRGKYAGIAPDANLVSIKVGSSDGSADASNVLAGIQWAVSFRDRYDIRVLNLSLGTDSTQDWRLSPLNYAVERAWWAGIAVVVAASNRGPDPGTISKPGDDPWVITVGATDDVATVKLGDDVLPDFSSRGPAPNGVAKPDVVAPGAHLVSLRAIGSTIDQAFPDGVNKTYRQGSGTSMATAVVSGAAAAMLSHDPTMSPNRLKFALAETARPVAVDSPDAVGRGMVDAFAAAVRAPDGEANEGLDHATGLGGLFGLDPTRGSLFVTAGGVLVNGLLTAQLLTWDLIGFLLDWTETSWYASQLFAAPWRLTAWHGEFWEGHNWEGCSWDESHSYDCGYGGSWKGSAWYGAWD